MLTALAWGALPATTLAYGAGTVAQAAGARRLAAAAPRALPPLRRLGRSLPYVGGLALDGVGFVASVVALTRLPLFLVQAGVAASVAVTAAVGAVVLGDRLSARDVAGLSVTLLGLTALAVSALPGPSRRPGNVGAWLLLGGAGALAALTAVGVRGHGRARTIPAVLAGFGYAGVGIAARSLPPVASALAVVRAPAAWAILLFGAAGTVAFTVALTGGSVVAPTAVAFAIETIVPAVVGLGVLGDRVRSGWVPVLAVGIVATVGGAVAIARPEARPPSSYKL